LPGVMSVAMVAVLLGLGFWQLDRLAWKQDILARIDRAEGGTAVALTTSPSPFAKVRVQGTFRHAQTAYYGADVQLTPAGPKMGARLIVPIDRAEGPPVLVDRGWVPLERQRPIAQPQGPVTVEGYVRLPEARSWFSPEDDRAARHFYTLDPAVIGAAVGAANAAPFVVVVLGQRPAEMFPMPAQRMPRPPNDHLNYAITWFGLAFILSVIFILYARTVLRA
jgi:surfeit locus 1 family protein